MNTYKAPWGKTLTIVSILVTVLCASVAVLPRIIPTLDRAGPAIGWLLWLPILMIPACALFTVRGYTITPEAILIHRPFRDTRLPRADLQSATYLPHAMRGSIRTCGNSGFYSVTGWYWSKSLRSYSAFVTDLNRTVVLRFQNRTIVVSPDDPEQFARELDTPGHHPAICDCQR
jgi:hypothetical protein